MSAFTAAVSFKTLSELRLGGNRITVQCHCLLCLPLPLSTLQRLPAGLAEACPALTKLDLSHNRLQSIPVQLILQNIYVFSNAWYYWNMFMMCSFM